jgi:hypothetical protein
MAVAAIAQSVRDAIVAATAALPPFAVYQSVPIGDVQQSAAGLVVPSNPSVPISVYIGAAGGLGVATAYWATPNANSFPATTIPSTGVVSAPFTTLTFSGTFAAGDTFVLNTAADTPTYRVVCDMTAQGLGARAWYLDATGAAYTLSYQVNGKSYATGPIPAVGSLTRDTFSAALLATDPIPPFGNITASQYGLAYLSCGLWYSAVA